MKIAIVGSGIAGLTAAHVLGPHHTVTLFEAADRIGGHSNTVTVNDPDVGPLGIDTGFIVHNDRNYPKLQRLFADLGVRTVDTEMSFGVSDEASGVSYRATSLNTLFADRRNIFRPQVYRMVVDIARFYRNGRAFLLEGDNKTSLAEFLRSGSYSEEFVNLHLIPMGASVWSADPASFAEFPARTLLRFLDNHGLLSVRNRPQWKALVGGSRSYVDLIVDRFPGTIKTNSPVTSIARDPQGVTVRTDRTTDHFDAVVLACHSDQALTLLADPTPAEKEILGSIRYQPNSATLHTDPSVMPDRRLAWSAWNYYRRKDGKDAGAPVLTYDMTELMKLDVPTRYFVSLNDDRVDPSTVLYQTTYTHPIFDGPAIAAQERVTEISGVNNTHFAGAYWKYGFHEDGMVSGLRACGELGIAWPATGQPSMEPGPAALCEGTVWHRRSRPAVNEFTYQVSQVWIDPERPEALTSRHPLWSSTRFAPARFRRKDYGPGTEGSIGQYVRNAVAPLLGHQPTGPIRMLTQIRRWGWLFNPITMYVVWDAAGTEPVAAVAEVTNTPWKERTHYPLLLERQETGVWSATFDKSLHVSPFLGQDYFYNLRIIDRAPELELHIDVCSPDTDEPIVQTAVRVTRTEPTPGALTRSLFRHALSTRRVSFGIHSQALRLGLKRVPFVPHPKRHSPT
ncbi:MAG: DUF1365 family protein [Acidimicrobiales bacterium]|nr:DUF1365 family protein [Acidimicrobiales bacterium]